MLDYLAFSAILLSYLLSIDDLNVPLALCYELVDNVSEDPALMEESDEEKKVIINKKCFSSFGQKSIWKSYFQSN